jgi:protein involved in temperature-dependent protein secretion
MGQALQAHAQAVALNPADARFRIYYGQALMKADRHAQAREQFLTAGRLDQAIVSLDPESNKRLTQAELQRLQQLLAEAMLGAGAS